MTLLQFLATLYSARPRESRKLPTSLRTHARTCMQIRKKRKQTKNAFLPRKETHTHIHASSQSRDEKDAYFSMFLSRSSFLVVASECAKLVCARAYARTRGGFLRRFASIFSPPVVVTRGSGEKSRQSAVRCNDKQEVCEKRLAGKEKKRSNRKCARGERRARLLARRDATMN